MQTYCDRDCLHAEDTHDPKGNTQDGQLSACEV